MKNIADGISSPNPNYEQKVKSVTGENMVRVRGKNLLNTLNLFVYGYKGVTYTPVYENGKLLYIDVNGTATEISFMSIQILLKPNSKYYISGCPLNGSNDTYKDMILDSIYYTSSASDFGNGVSLSTGSKTSWQYRIRINAGYTCNHLKFYPMIEEASDNQTEPSEYEPYYEPQEKPLNLGDLEVFENGYFSRENGKWYLNNEYEKSNLTAQFIQGNPSNRFVLTKDDYNKFDSSSVGYSNIGLVKSTVQEPTDSEQVYFYIQPNAKYLNAYVKYNSMTLAQFNNKIQELINNNIIPYVILKLATPSKVEIPNQTLINQLNDIYKLMSYDGTTIIETECEVGNMPIIISASALLDSAKAIEDLETRIEVLESEE
jgi:hypothetical protein